MPRLEVQEHKKLYYFRNEKTGAKLRKFSGDGVSNDDILEFQIPDFLIEQQPKNKEKSKYA